MIYCVEDERNIRELIVYTLEASGLQAKGFCDGKELDAGLKEKLPELILLDIMLPEEDGMSILKRLKEDVRTADIPVIMVTAKDAEYDKVLGLDMGADDFIAKPFGMMEFVARVKVALRRNTPKNSGNVISYGDITINKERHEVAVNGQNTELTLKEYEMLCYLIENKGIVMTRDQLLERIWGYDFNGETRTVDVHIRTLRQKLGEAGSVIETIRGVGYRVGGK